MSSTSNTEMPNHQEIEVLKFEKYSKIAPELRNHALTFLDLNTLFAYSQCSKECNAEVQLFNTEAPEKLIINQLGNVVNVSLDYEIAKVDKQFVVDEDTNTMEEIGSYLRKCYKYVRTGNSELIIDVKKWPTRMLDVPYLSKTDYWRVTMYAAMFDACMEYLRTRGDNIKSILMEQGENEKVTIPSKFFTFPFVRKVGFFASQLPCSIETVDFVNLQTDVLYLCCAMDFDAIREKVRHVNANENIKMGFCEIQLPDDDHRQFELEVLFPNQPIQRRSDGNACIIGKVIALLADNVLTLEDIITND